MRTSAPWILGLAGVLTVGAFAAGVASRADEWRVTVRGSGVDLGETPIVTEVPSTVASASYHLRPVSGGDSVDAQAFDHGQARFLAFILPQVTASQFTLFSLEARTPKDVDPGKGLAVRPHAANLIVNLDGKLLSEYRLDSGRKPIFFPLIGPTGESYTRAYPTENVPGEQHDHPHQRSCWFTHGKVNGVDFWAEGAKCGSIKETGRNILAEGPVLACLATTDDWLAPDGRRVCADVRTVTFYHSLQSRIIDFEFTIRATDGPLTFGETKEGMFGLRVASSMDVNKKTGGQITNAEGVTDDKAWGKPSPWVDYIGPVKDKTVGVAVLNHPSSFRFPTAWHVRPYGLFAANPFGGHEFGGSSPGAHTVPPGETMSFRYRVILHDGDTRAAHVDRLFAAYANPPTVAVTKK